MQLSLRGFQAVKYIYIWERGKKNRFSGVCRHLTSNLLSCYFVTAISTGGERGFKLTTTWKILQYLFGNRSQKNRKNLEGKLISEAYSEPSRTSKMKLFAKIDHGFQPLTIFLKSSILDVPLDSEYASEYHAILNIISSVDPWNYRIITFFYSFTA